MKLYEILSINKNVIFHRAARPAPTRTAEELASIRAQLAIVHPQMDEKGLRIRLNEIFEAYLRRCHSSFAT